MRVFSMTIFLAFALAIAVTFVVLFLWVLGRKRRTEELAPVALYEEEEKLPRLPTDLSMDDLVRIVLEPGETRTRVEAGFRLWDLGRFDEVPLDARDDFKMMAAAELEKLEVTPGTSTTVFASNGNRRGSDALSAIEQFCKANPEAYVVNSIDRENSLGMRVEWSIFEESSGIRKLKCTSYHRSGIDSAGFGARSIAEHFFIRHGQDHYELQSSGRNGRDLPQWMNFEESTRKLSDLSRTFPGSRVYAWDDSGPIRWDDQAGEQRLRESDPPMPEYLVFIESPDEKWRRTL